MTEPGIAFEHERARGWSRAEMAAAVAADIPAGAVVNLGIGIPTLVADHLPVASSVLIHSENGILGVGPKPVEKPDPWVINAGKEHVTVLPGAAYLHHADSFAIIRGAHLDLSIMGAFEVSVAGDLANWSAGDVKAPAVGGAMDLAAGARQVWVVMEHVTREGRPRLVERCGYPFTALGVVKRIYTDLANIAVTPHGFVAVDLAPGVTAERLQALTGAPISCAATVAG